MHATQEGAGNGLEDIAGHEHGTTPFRRCDRERKCLVEITSGVNPPVRIERSRSNPNELSMGTDKMGDADLLRRVHLKIDGSWTGTWWYLLYLPI